MSLRFQKNFDTKQIYMILNITSHIKFDTKAHIINAGTHEFLISLRNASVYCSVAIAILSQNL